MSKTIKVIELLNEVAKGNNLIFQKDGGSYKDSLWTFLYMYLHNQKSFDEIKKFLNNEVEIIEQQDVDIQGIEEIEPDEITDVTYYINDLIRAVKQLDRKMKEGK